SVLTNDTDADLPNDSLTAVLVSGPTHAAPGSFTLNGNGTFSYTHDGSEVFVDSFTYKVMDAASHTSNTTTVQFFFPPLTHNPSVANPDSLNLPAGGTVPSLVRGATSVLTNDTDIDLPNDTLTAVLVGGPTHASGFTLNGNGTFSYTSDGS